MARWERGYRTHGYWRDESNERLGRVSIGPRGLWDGVYLWEIDGSRLAGTANTLAKAKRAVERVLNTHPSNGKAGE